MVFHLPQLTRILWVVQVIGRADLFKVSLCLNNVLRRQATTALQWLECALNATSQEVAALCLDDASLRVQGTGGCKVQCALLCALLDGLACLTCGWANKVLEDHGLRDDGRDLVVALKAGQEVSNVASVLVGLGLGGLVDVLSDVVLCRLAALADGRGDGLDRLSQPRADQSASLNTASQLLQRGHVSVSLTLEVDVPLHHALAHGPVGGGGHVQIQITELRQLHGPFVDEGLVRLLWCWFCLSTTAELGENAERSPLWVAVQHVGQLLAGGFVFGHRQASGC